MSCNSAVVSSICRQGGRCLFLVSLTDRHALIGLLGSCDEFFAFEAGQKAVMVPESRRNGRPVDGLKIARDREEDHKDRNRPEKDRVGRDKFPAPPAHRCHAKQDEKGFKRSGIQIRIPRTRCRMASYLGRSRKVKHLLIGHGEESFILGND